VISSVRCTFNDFRCNAAKWAKDTTTISRKAIFKPKSVGQNLTFFLSIVVDYMNEFLGPHFT
jgi:hypothetical protein